jgi:hypothetical protein
MPWLKSLIVEEMIAGKEAGGQHHRYPRDPLLSHPITGRAVCRSTEERYEIAPLHEPSVLRATPYHIAG